MAILEVLKHPNPVLSRKADIVTEIDPQTRVLVQNMFETMFDHDGIGLAAPQIGVSRRIIVFSPNARREEARMLFNPRITERSRDITIQAEGCLSVPGVVVEIPRSRKIKFTALDLNGDPIEEVACDHVARIIQHEVDHLNGILLIDRAPLDQRQAFTTQANQRS
jgi:peptide deformylase